MKTVGNWIAESLDHRTDAAVLKRVRRQVEELAEQFPLYPERRARTQVRA
jgi:glycine hydroxymethyltransferase